MKKKKPECGGDEKPPSALSVVPGQGGGHDGMPGKGPRRRGGEARTAGISPLKTDAYVRGVLAGDRTVLGRAITLVESNAPGHQEQGQELLRILLPRAVDSIRVGITGTPGSGKSTFIETLGTMLTERGHKVAVMAVDPSSSVSGGSILGDKTRMERLARNPSAFIRPSPTGGTLGGVARKTRETIVLFEAAGYDVILVETVGVGQNEIAVRSLVDFFLLFLVAGGGDELQGIKKGVMELADALVVNKADGDNVVAAATARAEYARALHYLRPATEGWRTESFTASALTGDGVAAIWDVIGAFRRIVAANGVFDRRRRDQAVDWLHGLIEEGLKEMFYRHPAVADVLPGIEGGVKDGSLPAVRAALRLLDIYRKSDRAGAEAPPVDDEEARNGPDQQRNR
jgi:LAO/AO transport system kinase